jgi:hypothetical protein
LLQSCIDDDRTTERKAPKALSGRRRLSEFGLFLVGAEKKARQVVQSLSESPPRLVYATYQKGHTCKTSNIWTQRSKTLLVRMLNNLKNRLKD